MLEDIIAIPAPLLPPHLALVCRIISDAFDEGSSPQTDSLIERSLGPSVKPHRGEIAFKTFLLASDRNLTPKQVADTACSALLKYPDLIAHTNIDLPYVNISLNYSAFANQLVNISTYIESSIIQANKTIVIEHTQPNTHKALHIGHLRNTILGDTIYRLLRLFYMRAYAVDYHGDEGMHVARVVWFIKNHYPDIRDIEPSGSWLGDIYPQAVSLSEAPNDAPDSKIRNDISDTLKNIENRSGKDFEIWSITRRWSLDYFKSIYEWLGVHFDDEFCESAVSVASQNRVDEYLKKGVFVESEGAIGCDLNEYDLGFCLLRKSDGTGLYATKDVELLIERYSKYHFDACIYVVDKRQHRHFQQVFHTVHKMGYAAGLKCHHLAYDVVKTKEGGLSSRKGGAISAHALLNRLTEIANENIRRRGGSNEPSEDMETAAHDIALASIRYGMLKVDAQKPITFDIEGWSNVEGNTGPYLLYTVSRMGSILRKADKSIDDIITISNNKSELLSLLSHDRERIMLDAILRAPSVIHESASQLRPSILCSFIFNLSQLFNSYYSEVKILSEPNHLLRAARLQLLETLVGLYKIIFALLGINVVERL